MKVRLIEKLAVFQTSTVNVFALIARRHCSKKTAVISLRQFVAHARFVAHFGGYVKPAYGKAEPADRSMRIARSGKRQSVVVMRERAGTLTFVGACEAGGVALVANHVKAGTIVDADEASFRDVLHALYVTFRINHGKAYSLNGACTNQAESFFSRLRRAEVGTHHHIAEPYLNAYAGELAWREDNRRVPNGTQAALVSQATMVSPVSRKRAGCWQRG